MTRRNRLADLLRFYGDRPRAGGARDPVESERDWIDVDAEDDGDGDPEAGLPLARTFGPGTRPLTWKEHLGALRHAMDSTREDTAPDWPPGREVLYVVDPAATIAQGALVLEVLARDPRKRGGFTQLRRPRPPAHTARRAPGGGGPRRSWPCSAAPAIRIACWLDSHPSYGAVSHRYLVPPDLHGSLMPLLCRTGRAWLRASPADADSVKLGWDDGAAFTPSLDVRADPKSGYYVVTGSLCRGAERVELSAVRLLLAGGLVFAGERVARLDDAGAFPGSPTSAGTARCASRWRRAARSSTRSSGCRACPASSSPTSSSTRRSPRRPGPAFGSARRPAAGARSRLRAALGFDYDGAVIRMDRGQRGRLPGGAPPLPPTGPECRAAGRGAPPAGGLRRAHRVRRATGRARHSTCPRETWRARWASSSRRAGTSRPTASSTGSRAAFKIEVSSGIDWFELHGTVDFGRPSRTLPELLAALRRGESTVLLGDGTFGVLPGGVAAAATGCSPASARRTDDHAALPAQPGRPARRAPRGAPEVERRRRLRPRPRRAARVRGHRAARPARELLGELRGYQREGSAGCASCERFGFGGCLADDMGLGKTVQVLALLDARRERARPRRRPSAGPAVARRRAALARLQLEAARRRASRPSCACSITPAPDRAAPATHFERLRPRAHDLRHAAPRRAALCRTSRFDYVILDEAQAIKNATHRRRPRPRACCARDHRLALSGTPIENHLGELWSLFEFLNPGMLGAASAFDATSAPARDARRERARCSPAALRPFILRRTKEQVAPDLPAKTEQTLVLRARAAEQRKLYDELRDHYRARAARHASSATGIGAAKIQVLEALLRLRQAACHPGLVDTHAARRAEREARRAAAAARRGRSRKGTRRSSSRSSQLPRHRARRGSTSAGIAYEYLDGRTRDRQRASSASRTIPTCRLFLDQPEGRRPRPQPDRGRVRLPARSLVEPGRRGAGHRPRAPHRPDAPRLRLPAHRARHRRGEGARAAADRSARWPTPSSPPTTA